MPVYPVQELEKGIEGTVVLRVFISESGKPGDIQVKMSSGSARLDFFRRSGDFRNDRAQPEHHDIHHT